MGLVLSIGVIWLTYQIFNSIDIETDRKRADRKLIDVSERKAA